MSVEICQICHSEGGELKHFCNCTNPQHEECIIECIKGGWTKNMRMMKERGQDFVSLRYSKEIKCGVCNEIYKMDKETVYASMKNNGPMGWVISAFFYLFILVHVYMIIHVTMNFIRDPTDFGNSLSRRINGY